MSRYPYRQSPHPLAGSNSERQSVGDLGHCEDCCSVGHVVAHPDLGCGDVGCDVSHEYDLPQTLESLMAVAGEMLRTYTASPIDPAEYEALERELETSRGMNTDLRQENETLRQDVVALGHVQQRNERQAAMLRAVYVALESFNERGVFKAGDTFSIYDVPSAGEVIDKIMDVVAPIRDGSPPIDVRRDVIAERENVRADLKTLARNVIETGFDRYTWAGGDHSNHSRRQIADVAAEALVTYSESDVRLAQLMSKFHEPKSTSDDR